MFLTFFDKVNLKPSISTRTRLLICFVLQHSAVKTKHLRDLVWGVIWGFEWVEILGLILVHIKNSSECSKVKPRRHCCTVLFPVYQNNNWIIKLWNDGTIIPSSHCIMLMIFGFWLTRKSYSSNLWLCIDDY